MTELSVIRGDITTLEVDAVVNAANAQLRPGGGVDGAIHRAGGPSIAAEGRAIVAERGPLATGEAAATTAGDLPARWVIHTVGPVWGRHHPEQARELLASCYRNSLDLAAGLGGRSVAFPNISTGVYGFPKREAAETAVAAVRSWMDEHPDDMDRIVFVCFDADNYDLYRELLD
ncbi:MAG: O-acetyl-ADP-ribose deacetylase [Acidimicrobiia bacterium]